MRAAISTVGSDPARLLERVLASPQMAGADLARVVSTPEPYTIRPSGLVKYRVVAVDLGIKAATPRNLAARGAEVLVVPATASAEQILAASPDGVFFSNGPGDPAAATYAVDAMRGVLDAGLPVFGICLGSQILALALGLSTYKLRYGHRGVNQPVMDLATGRVYITSHNHGFAAALPGETKATLPRSGREPARPPGPTCPRRRASRSKHRTARRPSATSTSTTAWCEGLRRWSARCSGAVPPGGGPRTARRRLSVRSVLRPRWGRTAGSHAARDDLQVSPGDRLRADRHRAGLRVRLLRHPGCRVLRAEGLRVSLVNSNPATIMTDPEFADQPTSNPSRPAVERVIASERPTRCWRRWAGRPR